MCRYPDVDDRNLFENIIDADWEDGGLEAKYIEECISVMPKEARISLLDAGCGTGRLLPAYISSFQKIIAVDPDINRLNKASSLFGGLSVPGHSPVAEFVNASIQELALDEQVDFVLCSQIIQHVVTSLVPAILKKLHQHLNSSGYLMLLTTNWRSGEDKFLKVNSVNNEHVSISEDEYNRCANNNDHFLPVRLFSEEELTQLLANAGFKVIFIKKYHGHPKIKGDNFILAQRQKSMY